jgi:hypothetical protein
MSYLDEERKVISDLLKLATSDVQFKRETYKEYKEKIMALAALHDLNLQKEDPDKYFLRAKRRDYYTKQGIIVPPGEWDSDLDMYNEREYSVHIPFKGYTGKIKRNILLSWNGYVTVPEGHWSIGKDLTGYNFPFEITYHNGKEIGFSHYNDKTPLGVFFGRGEEPDKKYTSFMEVFKEVIKFTEYLHNCKN